MKKHVTLAVVALVAFASSLFALPARSAEAAYTFGQSPYLHADYWAGYWVNQLGLSTDPDLNKRLTSSELLAMMIAISVPETGSGPNAAPSPMTLGRYDLPKYMASSINLWESWTAATPYPRAFQHEGVGLYQLDSSGVGKNLGADARIYSYSSANRTAEELAKMWKSSTATTRPARRAYAWAQWMACSDRNECEPIFNQIFQNGGIVNVNTTSAVTSYGGAVWTTCWYKDTPSSKFSCLRVNPENAEGGNLWWVYEQPDYGRLPDGPTPITFTFYTFNGSQEYRFWKRQQTGYGIDIESQRTMGTNARDTIVWLRYNSLCTAEQGSCP